MFLTQDVACAALQRVWQVGLTHYASNIFEILGRYYDHNALYA